MAKVIKLGQYKNIEVEVESKQVTDEMVEQQVNTIVAQNPMLVDKEGLVENGDITIIDFEGFKEGVPFDGGKAEGYQLEIGSGSFIPGFEEQMVGMAKGETRELNLTFPENYGAAELAGAAVVFKVTVHQIKNKQVSELSDEYVVSFGNPNLKTVEDLKQMVRFQLEDQFRQERARIVEDKVLDILLSASEVEFNEDELKETLQRQKDHLASQVTAYGMTLEQYLAMSGMDEETLNKQLEPSAMSQIKYESIIKEIINIENIDATDEDANMYLESMAMQMQQPKEELVKHIDLELLKGEIKTLKANKIIMSTVIAK